MIGRLLLILAILIGAALPGSTGRASPLLQGNDPMAQARDLLERMTPEERVGQIFLVSFNGNQVDVDTQIYNLIRTYHVGGVVLMAANDNFVSEGQTVVGAYRLTGDLQRAIWDLSQGSDVNPETDQSITFNYIPMLIGVSQNGDGYPNDEILEGLTPLPSLMSVGATWQTELADRVGRVLGRELEALGINLVLGPSLDVLDPQYTSAESDLGVNSFGSDPFWVQEMGKAYISGLHVGGQNRLAVVAKHYPGQGGSDRDPETEVATVRKSLEDLKQIDLAPFFAVTNSVDKPDVIADGFFVSHIRYQGFQGNIREATRPVSLDKTAIDELMKLPEFMAWHQNGGVLISDNLGSLSVRRFYESIGQPFDPRLVARDAFLAGNDILYIDDFTGENDPDSFTSLTRTLEYFAAKYRDDPAFAQRVDDSVIRILTMKYKLYPQFNLDTVLPDEKNLESIQKSEQVTFDVARSSATLINPDPSTLDSILPAPPDIRDRVLFITDSLTGSQCSYCDQNNGLTVDALQSAVLRLYGPSAGGEVNPSRLISYSFQDLINFLDYEPSEATEPYPIENDLLYSRWIIISILDVNSNRPSSVALNRLLSERPDLLRNKRVVVFSFNTPNYLDATDISRVSAYYAFYGKTPAFQEVAARVLFRELSPMGAPPVSVPGIGYDIMDATSPDPDQVIPLTVDTTQLPQAAETAATTPAPQPTPLTFKVNDTIPIIAGPILDHNGHLVPDNTIVRFSFVLDGGATGSTTTEAPTVQGMARAAYRIDRPGMLQISAASDPAKTSFSLQLNVTGDTGAQLIAITPTPRITETPQPTPTITPSPTVTLTPTPVPPAYPNITDWVLSMLIIGLSGILTYFAGVYRASQRWGVRWGLCTVLGGLIAYSLLAVGMPGGGSWLQTEGTRGVLLFTVFGITLGIGGGLAWRAWLERSFPPSTN